MDGRRLRIPKESLTDSIRDEVKKIIEQSKADIYAYTSMNVYHSPQLRERIDLFLTMSGKSTIIVPRMGREFHMEYLLLTAAYVDPKNYIGWKFTELPEYAGNKDSYLYTALTHKVNAFELLLPQDRPSYTNPNIQKDISTLRALSIELHKAEFMHLYHKRHSRYELALNQATVKYFTKLEHCCSILVSELAEKTGLHCLPVDKEPASFQALEIAFGFDYLWPGYSDSYFEHNGMKDLIKYYSKSIVKASNSILDHYDAVRRREIECKIKVNKFSCHKASWHQGRYSVDEVLLIKKEIAAFKTVQNPMNVPGGGQNVHTPIRSPRRETMDEENT